MKKLLSTTAILVAGLFVVGTTAHAAPIPPFGTATTSAFYTAPANGTLTFTYEGFSAADKDATVFDFNGNSIFTNTSTTPGTVVTESVIAGNTYKLSLNNTVTGDIWSSDPTLNSDSEPHLVYTGDYSNFNIGTPPVTVNTNCAPAAGQCYLGWEDLPITGGAGTVDYNDLVFAEQFTPSAVPEPASLALLGAALVGLGLIRRRRSGA